MDFKLHYILTEEPDISNKSDWRQRMVWHRTSTGQRNKVKVKSLPPEEQWKYAPLDIKLKRKAQKKDIQVEPKGPPVEKKVFNVYFDASARGGIKDFEEGKLVVSTDDSAKAIDIEENGHDVGVARAVPMEAFKYYYKYDEEKFELIKFTDNDLYLVDLFPYKDKLQIQLSDEGKIDNE
jgi:hypothetical protein